MNSSLDALILIPLVLSGIYLMVFYGVGPFSNGPRRAWHDKLKGAPTVIVYSGYVISLGISVIGMYWILVGF